MFSRCPSTAPSHLSPTVRLLYRSYSKPPALARAAWAPYLVVLCVWLQQAVLLDGHGWGKRHGVSPLLPFFFSTALHARRGGFRECATAQALVPASLKSNQHSLITSWALACPCQFTEMSPKELNRKIQPGQKARWHIALTSSFQP